MEARVSLLQHRYSASSKPNRNTTSSRVDHAILPIQLGENLVSRQVGERMILQLVLCPYKHSDMRIYGNDPVPHVIQHS